MKLPRILTLIAVAVACHAQAQPKADDLIVEMNQAFRQGNRARLAQLLPLVHGHTLEPWAAYWELKSRLDTALPQEVQDFFTRYAGTYQEDRLRNDWLLLLGQRCDWTNFEVEYPKFRMNDDREVRCYALLVTHVREGPAEPAGLVEEVRRNWLAQRDVDDGCTLAASRLIGDTQALRRMSANDAWRKARLALEANHPRAAAAAIEIVAPEAMGQFNELNRSPAKYLTSRVVVASKARKEMMVLALIKLAAGDAENAARQLESKWGPQLTPEERNWVWGVIAKQAAQRLGNDALEHYAKVSRDADLTDGMLAWKARAALRALRGPQWPVVLQAINAMSPTEQRDPAWVYWKARGLNALAVDSQDGDAMRGLARELFSSIAGQMHFYAKLATEELGDPITLPSRPAALMPEEEDAAARHPGLVRALQLIAIGLRNEGVREWNYSLRGMSDRELLAAAQLACDREVWDRCINTSDRTRNEVHIGQRFPTPFRKEVQEWARASDLDPAYVYGLIRQESRFVMDARSAVGASGLMQLMPSTARWTAKKIGANYNADLITDRDTNIKLGTSYLKLVLDNFDGSQAMAAAAYNAGPSRSRRWRDGPVLEPAVWAENIPFNETRDYVKKVLSNATDYAAILGTQAPSLKSRLGRLIGPPDPNAPTPDPALP